MLRALTIRDFVIVDTLELEFDPGFTVLTGETGAGKSILIDALALALGERGDAAVVRAGCERADISAEFDIQPLPELARWLRAAELEGDPDSILLRRVIDQSGRSRAFVNGRPATLSQLREAGEWLVDIHGQHAHQSLLKAEHSAHCSMRTPASRRLRPRWRRRTGAAEAGAGPQEHDTDAARASRTRAIGVASQDMERLALLRPNGRPCRPSTPAWRTGWPDRGRAGGARHPIRKRAGRRLLAAGTRLEEVLGTTRAWARRRHPLRARRRCRRRFMPCVITRNGWTLIRSGWRDRTAHGRDARHGAQIPPCAAGIARAPAAAAGPPGGARDASNLEARREEQQARGSDFELAARPAPAGRRPPQSWARRSHAPCRTWPWPAARSRSGCWRSRTTAAGGVEQIEFMVRPTGVDARALAKVASGGELSRISLAIQVASGGRWCRPLIFDEVDAGIGGARSRNRRPPAASPRARRARCCA